MRLAMALLVLVLAAGWYFREPLQRHVDAWLGSKPATATLTPGGREAESPRKDTVYRWVDENGVTHFDQRPVDGSEAVVVDQAKIRSMEGEVSESGTPVVSLPPGEEAGAAPAE